MERVNVGRVVQSLMCVGGSFTVLEKKLRLWLFALTIRLSYLTCSVTCVSYQLVCFLLSLCSLYP